MELIYRRNEDKVLEDLLAVAVLPDVRYVALTPDIAVASVYLGRTLNLNSLIHTTLPRL